jgi:two-component system OmpR family sensor kinase
VNRLLRDSIRVRLSLGLSLAILIVAVTAGVFSFLAARDEANELQDETLQQVATLLARVSVPLARLDRTGAAAAGDEFKLLVQALGPGAAAAGDLPLRADLSEGFHTVQVAGEGYRVLVKATRDGRRIAVSQAQSVRDELARDGALRSVLPLLILVPVLLWVVSDLVRRLLAPVTRLADEIEGRSNEDLHPMVSERLPAELRPFVDAINRLMARVSQSVQAQRRFIADAAHELRSPLTALSLQAERLERAEMSGVARERLLSLSEGIARARHLLEQLLNLARVQADTPTPDEGTSVEQVVRHVLADVLPLAEARQIDIGMLPGPDLALRLPVAEIDLLLIVKNLIENALRYTPVGGQVDVGVSLVDGQALIQVEDNGPGIAPEERERVLDAFYRVLGSEQIGSGLGLTIVRAAVDRLGGRMALADAQRFAHGLLVSVWLPMSR